MEIIWTESFSSLLRRKTISPPGHQKQAVVTAAKIRRFFFVDGDRSYHDVGWRREAKKENEFWPQKQTRHLAHKYKITAFNFAFLCFWLRESDPPPPELNIYIIYYWFGELSDG
nr:hypothetical protein Iba_chr14aCG16570 [Ipomoea batatas]